MTDTDKEELTSSFDLPRPTAEQAIDFANALKLPGYILEKLVWNAVLVASIRSMIVQDYNLQDMDEMRRQFEAHRITVSHRSAPELIQQAKEGIGTTRIASGLLSWNFMRDECGKTYQVLTHRFGREVNTNEVRQYFQALGFTGSTPAFVEWVTKNKPGGYHTSIPDDDRLWHRPSSSHLNTVCFRHRDGRRDLDLNSIRGLWDVLWVFVGFREIPQK